MRMYDIIAKKRDGFKLTTEEIDFWIKGYTNGSIPDYQASALLMAIFLRGMDEKETLDLTIAMAQSGEQMDLSSIKGIKVDKHSTGGVGDKTTLILGPLVASASVPVAKMSGRGLGHTGGTIDKLDAIPGFKTELTMQEFIHNVNSTGIAIAGQTGNLVPADKKIYALRDVTATVNNIALIASSIMSKKIAAGSNSIVLDVKTGSGAFMKEKEAAFELAEEMVNIGWGAGKEVVAIISDMDQPLGYSIGNSLEVIEAIDTLKGRGPQDLTELCLVLGAHMLVLAKKANSVDEAKNILKGKLHSGQAIEKLIQLIESQGGNKEVVYNYNLFPKSKHILSVKPTQDGFIRCIDSEKVGIASLIAGAGRLTKESKIDLSSGIILKKKIGQKVSVGETIAEIHSNDKDKVSEAEILLQSAISISSQPVISNKLVHGIVRKESIEKNKL